VWLHHTSPGAVRASQLQQRLHARTTDEAVRELWLQLLPEVQGRPVSLDAAQRLQIGHEFCNSIWKRHEAGLAFYMHGCSDEIKKERHKDVPEISKGMMMDLINFGFQVNADALPIIQEAWAKRDQERFNNVIESFAVAKALIQDLSKILTETTIFWSEPRKEGDVLDETFFDDYRKRFMKYKSDIQTELQKASVTSSLKRN
jgi:hypothetical protein